MRPSRVVAMNDSTAFAYVSAPPAHNTPAGQGGLQMGDAIFMLGEACSLEDVQAASQACQILTSSQHGLGVPHGCWIGLTDHNAEGQYVWSDGTPVDYLNWGPGQPDQFSEGAEEDGVQIDSSEVPEVLQVLGRDGVARAVRVREGV